MDQQAPTQKNSKLVLTAKQSTALTYLEDEETTEVLYGGAAGGGKSLLGCTFIISRALKYPNTRYALCRAVLKNLKDSTLLTFWDVCRKLGLESGTHYTYKEQAGIIRFFNGSEVYLKDLFLYPTDPDFDSLGSTEYTAAFIDECSQVTEKAKNVLVSRLRYRTKELGIKPKILLGTNPTKNFAYRDFYKPAVAGTIVSYRKFVPATSGDNPYLDPQYIVNLGRLDKLSRERLLLGNWEYDDDPSAMFTYNKVLDAFVNKFAVEGKMYMTVDVARLGKDRTTVFIWNGLRNTHLYTFQKQVLTATRDRLIELEKIHKVPRSNVAIDEDGVGGGLVDMMPGCYGFVNNSSPLPMQTKDINYGNLKSQCYDMFAKYVNTDQVAFQWENAAVKELFIEELEQIKKKDIDKDGKFLVVPKDKMKEALGRSPDYADGAMMRFVFEFKNQVVVAW